MSCRGRTRGGTVDTIGRYHEWGDWSSHDSDVRVARFGSTMMRSVPRLSIKSYERRMRRQQLFFTFRHHVGVGDNIIKQNSGSPDIYSQEMTVAMALYAEWLFFYRLFRVSYARQDTVKNRRRQIRRRTRSIQKLPSIR